MNCPHCGGPLTVTHADMAPAVNVNGLNGAPYVTVVSIAWPPAAAGGMPPIKLWNVSVGGGGR